MESCNGYLIVIEEKETENTTSSGIVISGASKPVITAKVQSSSVPEFAGGDKVIYARGASKEIGEYLWIVKAESVFAKV